MDYTDFLKSVKEQIRKIEYAPVADEFDLLTELKQLIVDRQKTLLEHERDK